MCILKLKCLQFITHSMNFIFLTFFIPFSVVTSKLRSVGGRDAFQGEFPFILRIEIIYRNGYGLCSGTALAPTWGLTAAHCCPNINNNLEQNLPVRVRYNNFFPDNWGKTSNITACIKSPGNTDTQFHYDIALLKTQTMSVTRYAKLSSLDPINVMGSKGFVVGYGLTNVTGNPPPLQVVEGMFARCSSAIRSGYREFLCLRPPCNVMLSCTGGNSGGPVVHKSGVVGVMAIDPYEYDKERRHLYQKYLGDTCASQVIITHINWIVSVMKQDDQ